MKKPQPEWGYLKYSNRIHSLLRVNDFFVEIIAAYGKVRYITIKVI